MAQSKETTWFLIDTGPADGYTNMAVDESLLETMGQRGAAPVLRFYTWSQPTISVGYFQKVFEDFDLDACRQRGWPLVRRLTGGRAVFHDDELTYSIVLPRSSPEAGGGVLASYRCLSQGLLLGLRTLGVDASLVSRQDVLRQRSAGAGKSPDCFASPSWYEIKVGRAKLVGSAQRRMPHGILQHGSILFSTRAFPAFRRVLRQPANAERRPALRDRKEEMISLADVLPQRPSPLQLKEALKQGFQAALAIRLLGRKLSEVEKRRADQLLAKRYSRMSWNFHRKLPF
jgi:lipoate-protein ligase A